MVDDDRGLGTEILKEREDSEDMISRKSNDPKVSQNNIRNDSTVFFALFSLLL